MYTVTADPDKPNSIYGVCWRALCASAFIVATFAPTESAQGQTIDTNRPGFSFSPNVVAPGQWQLETGFSYERIDSDLSITSLPLAELRFGITDRTELFVSSLSFADASFTGGDASGLLDIVVGGKVNISNPDARMNMALLFQVSAPVGDDDFSSDQWDPSLAFVWAYDGNLPIAGTVKLSKFGSTYQLDNGLKLPFSLSDTTSAFVEWEANLLDGSFSTHWLNGGYQLLLADHMQIDFNAGVGLSSGAGDYRLGVGFSIAL